MANEGKEKKRLFVFSRRCLNCVRASCLKSRISLSLLCNCSCCCCCRHRRFEASITLSVTHYHHALVITIARLLTGPGWEDSIRQMAIAIIKIEILSTALKNTVRTS